MNDKFKELSALAQEKLIDPITGEEYYSFSRMKFAELIVRECMTICKEHPSRIVSNNWVADAVAPDVVRQFEEHFGVEE